MKRTEIKRPPYLRLVREDGPPSHKTQVVESEKKSNIKRLHQLYIIIGGIVDRLRKPLYIGVLAITTAAAGISWMNGEIKKTESMPYTVYPAADLNGDGTLDIIVKQKNDYKTPLYCLQDRKECVSAETMKSRYHRYADYEGIEDKLNEK